MNVPLQEKLINLYAVKVKHEDIAIPLEWNTYGYDEEHAKQRAIKKICRELCVNEDKIKIEGVETIKEGFHHQLNED